MTALPVPEESCMKNLAIYKQDKVCVAGMKSLIFFVNFLHDNL